MRLVLMFDLPVITKKQRRIYANFRKFLISRGYLMLQYSIYVKLFPNRDSAEQHISIIRKNAPNEGQIRIMILTEKQYARMEIIIGGKSRQEELITISPFLVL